MRRSLSGRNPKYSGSPGSGSRSYDNVRDQSASTSWASVGTRPSARFFALSTLIVPGSRSSRLTFQQRACLPVMARSIALLLASILAASLGPSWRQTAW